MMKQVLVVLALIGLGFSAPQEKKIFHEHIEDFLKIIDAEAGQELDHILENYLQFEEFNAALDYMKTNNFKDLVLEMESLPEFVAVVNFLENDNIDIHFFIDLINDVFEISRVKRGSRNEVSGTDLAAFVNDCIAVFPKEKLAALFDEKMTNDAEFATAINNLQSEEWDEVLSALIESETFQKEAALFLENGIDLHIVFDEILAVFGQN